MTMTEFISTVEPHSTDIHHRLAQMFDFVFQG